jgi:Rrf2 family iron-sulfur cluster assembly transcriptional regulator
MILSTRGRYAVMAMAELAQAPAGQPMPLAAIAEAQDIPLNYLEQIFACLRREQLVKAVRGPGGGYLAAQPAEQISIADIMFASEEKLEMTRCKTKAGCRHDGGRCVTHDLWEGLTEHIRSYLESVTLADLVQGRPLPSTLTPGATALYQIREPS